MGVPDRVELTLPLGHVNSARTPPLFTGIHSSLASVLPQPPRSLRMGNEGVNKVKRGVGCGWEPCTGAVDDD